MVARPVCLAALLALLAGAALAAPAGPGPSRESIRLLALAAAKEVAAGADLATRREPPWEIQAVAVGNPVAGGRCRLVNVTIWLRERIFHNGIERICPDTR